MLLFELLFILFFGKRTFGFYLCFTIKEWNRNLWTLYVLHNKGVEETSLYFYFLNFIIKKWKKHLRTFFVFRIAEKIAKFTHKGGVFSGRLKWLFYQKIAKTCQYHPSKNLFCIVIYTKTKVYLFSTKSLRIGGKWSERHRRSMKVYCSRALYVLLNSTETKYLSENALRESV